MSQETTLQPAECKSRSTIVHGRGAWQGKELTPSRRTRVRCLESAPPAQRLHSWLRTVNRRRPVPLPRHQLMHTLLANTLPPRPALNLCTVGEVGQSRIRPAPSHFPTLEYCVHPSHGSRPMMVVIPQGNGPVGHSNHSADGDGFARLWEPADLCAVEKAFIEKERTRKREKLVGAAHGHGVVQHHLRHDGHFAPARLKHVRTELDTGDRRASSRHACCGDSVATREPSVGVTGGDGDLRGESCGFQYFGGEEGARRPSHAAVGRPTEQAECFSSSFDLLKIEPRKLRTEFSFGGCEPSKPVAGRGRSPGLAVESMRTSCGSLSPPIPGRRLTNAKADRSDHDNIFSDTSSNMSPPSDCPVKIPERENISAPHHHESSGATYDDADPSSPRHYGLYEMAHVGLLAARPRAATQFRSLGICDEFADSCTSPAVALNDAHQETLQKARNPETATRLDNMKASILCHAFYPRLVEAYIRHRRVGASLELKKRLQDFQAQLRDWRPLNMADFKANEAVRVGVHGADH